MSFLLELFVFAGAAIWLGILLAPWRPWSTREQLSSNGDKFTADDLTVLIPARNEAATIRQTLAAIREQGRDIQIILVDDQSEDTTADIAYEMNDPNLKVVRGASLPDGWTGKLWALEQGIQQVQTEYLLLLDADIELKPGMLAAMRKKMDADSVVFLSIMARLRMENIWEKLLMPAFIFFFKLLYPFQLSNSANRFVAAAAGGCILTKVSVIKDIGGFSALHGTIIDDCSLAKQVKQAGCRTWIGLSQGVISRRRYESFTVICDMVARTAFAQLRYSWSLLMICTILLLLAAWSLPIGVIIDEGLSMPVGLVGSAAMVAAYLPTLRYYGVNFFWALSMPIVATLYLYMAWVSAIRYLRGTRAIWKGREYSS
ncbi:MAG: glycosyltransferase [Gammaproteobacteria bacterium]